MKQNTTRLTPKSYTQTFFEKLNKYNPTINLNKKKLNNSNKNIYINS